MFFLLLCVLLWLLFTFHASFDTFGWLMVVAVAWFLGFLDGGRSRDKNKNGGQDSVYPPDVAQDPTSASPEYHFQ